MDDVVEVFVEIPKGSRNKYEWDPPSARRFVLDRMLFSAVHYPGDYGFVPYTLSGDGDPLDALVILGEPTFPGCTIARARRRRVPDARRQGLATPSSSASRTPTRAGATCASSTTCPQHLLDEIEHFFSIYKDLERKTVTIEGWFPREDAIALVDEDRQRYDALPEKPPMP